ncbi:MAG: hypothetical protein ACXWQ5_22100, partial [Ktedonobacterales bacterium]
GSRTTTQLKAARQAHSAHLPKRDWLHHRQKIGNISGNPSGNITVPKRYPPRLTPVRASGCQALAGLCGGA